jgi:hypothetical protein
MGKKLTCTKKMWTNASTLSGSRINKPMTQMLYNLRTLDRVNIGTASFHMTLQNVIHLSSFGARFKNCFIFYLKSDAKGRNRQNKNN